MQKGIWNIKEMQRKFLTRQRVIESDNKGLEAKRRDSDFYEKCYNENLGRLDLNILLEMNSALQSPRSLIEFLIKLKESDREALYGSTSAPDTRNGFRSEIDLNLQEIYDQFPFLRQGDDKS